MFDLLSTAELTASCATVIVFLSWLFGRTWRKALPIAAALTLWLAAVLTAGATGALYFEGGLGVPGLAVAVIAPVIVLSVVGFGTEAGRQTLRAAPIEGLVAIQGVRMLGVSFVLLHAAGRLPAPFAPVAGWGDILAGALALALASWLASGLTRAKLRAASFWNAYGILDLIVAVGLGATSSPGPVRIFSDGLGSAIMTTLPWIMIPCFLVPSLLFVHIATAYKLRAAGKEHGDASGASGASGGIVSVRRPYAERAATESSAG